MRYLLALVLIGQNTLALADELPPASERFRAAGVDETPDFQRHVSPLLGRLGCNGRACHGSFQGQGGFRLSLFGYDFARDHRAISTRVDSGEPADSLLLLKPTAQVAHKGGERFTETSWSYHLLERWIRAGARTSSTRRLVRLLAEPAEVVLHKAGQMINLRVIAHWQDGLAEDVTCLCRFQTNDDAVAEVNNYGQIKIVGRGDTHVIAFYDNGVAAIPVLVPAGETAAASDPATRIDALIETRLRKLGISPAPLCSDTEFLRRASLDITGTLPTPREIDAFLADTASDKRKRKINELLDRPAYAAWWANRLGDFTGNSRFGQAEGYIGQPLAVQWYGWLQRRVAENMPYDQLVEGIVLALARKPDQSYQHYATQMSGYFREDAPLDFSRRETLPYYWTRRAVTKPEDKALAFAHSFLGVRLQCAQCHKHPFDRWALDDFQQFTAFFAPLQYGVAPESRSAFDAIARQLGYKGKNDNTVTQEFIARAQDGMTIPWRELYIATDRLPARTLKLLGDDVQLDAKEDPRRAIMQWLRRPDNPYLARAFVNRVWASYFHVGLIEPVDDLNPANPPSNPELLDYLTEDFRDGFDMKRLHRQIVSSQAYQRSWRPNNTNASDRRHFSRAVPRRLPAEVVYDALAQATAADADLYAVRTNLERRAIGHLSTHLSGTYAMHVFGKPERILACDCERSSTPSLLQAVFLQNDPLLHQRLDESGWLKETSTVDASSVREAYLRTVSRPPTAAEAARARAYIADASSPREGLRDLLWALLNSKEFVLNH